MRFHFGTCRHDEAQRNWNELGKAKEQILEEQRKYSSLCKEHQDYLSVCEAKIKHLEQVLEDLKKQQLLTQPTYIEIQSLEDRIRANRIPKECSFKEDKPKKTRKLT